MHLARRSRPSRLLLPLALVAVVAGVWAGVTPASAHDDVGEMTVTSSVQSGPATVRLEVGLVYDNDGHLAEDATVTAELTGPDGATVGPVPLERVDQDSALYGADVQVPSAGTWAATISSTGPTATATAAIEVTEDSTPPGSDDADGPGEGDGSGEGDGTSDSTLLGGEEDEQVFTTQVDEEAAVEEDDGGSNTTLWIVLGVLAVVVVGGGVVLATRRRGAEEA
ncbi:MAG: hypothetical protein ACYC2O_00255 [Microthrixaceae bacterium]